METEIIQTDSGSQYINIVFLSRVSGYHYRLERFESVDKSVASIHRVIEGTYINLGSDEFLPELCFPYYPDQDYIITMTVQQRNAPIITIVKEILRPRVKITTDDVLQFLANNKITRLQTVSRIIDTLNMISLSKSIDVDVKLRPIFRYCAQAGDNFHENNFLEWNEDSLLAKLLKKND